MTKVDLSIRLWIAFSILWAVLVVLYTWQHFPDISVAQRDRIEGMYAKLLEREKRINPEFHKKYGHVTAAGLAESVVRQGKADDYAANILGKWDGEIDFSAVEAQFERTKKQLPLVRIRYISLAAAFWSVPVVLSIFLGWIVSRSRNSQGLRM